MIYLELFWGFLKVGLFSFGGAYGAIPLIREVVLSYGWLDDAALSDMIAVSESTPGPIMVNLATYIGSTRGGVLGAALATLAVVTPAFCVILLVMAALKNVLERRAVRATLSGLEACVTGIILATGAWMLYENAAPAGGFDLRAAGLAAVLLAVNFGWKPLVHRKLSPVTLICIAAVLGAVVYSL